MTQINNQEVKINDKLNDSDEHNNIHFSKENGKSNAKNTNNQKAHFPNLNETEVSASNHEAGPA